MWESARVWGKPVNPLAVIAGAAVVVVALQIVSTWLLAWLIDGVEKRLIRIEDVLIRGRR